MNTATRIRDLTVDERMVWGDCPVCHAKDGQPCLAEVGIQIGQKADGSPIKTGEGAHVSRLLNAPRQVGIVPV
jgi:hypothetical protein